LPDGTTVASEITAIKNKLVDLVTKEDIKGLVKKEDLKNFLTKDDISGLATKKDVTDAEGRLEARINELMTKDGKNRLDAVDIALEELATDLGTTKDEITKQLTKFKSDLALDIAKLATKQDVLDSEKRIRDKQDEYVRQGMKADEALQAAIDAVAEEQGKTRDAILAELSSFQLELTADLEKLATKVQVSAVEKSILAKMKEYTDAGMDRDKALQKALDEANTNIDQLAKDLGTTKEAITQQLTDF
jgi:signal transduction protein with GAF and PtsI domain